MKHGLKSCQVRSSQVKSGQVRSGQVKSGQVRLGQVRLGRTRSLEAVGLLLAFFIFLWTPPSVHRLLPEGWGAGGGGEHDIAE